MCIHSAADKLHVYMSMSTATCTMGRGENTIYQYKELFERPRCDFIYNSTSGPICVTKIYFIFQPLQNDTVCLHCTVTATKRVDILHYGNKESNIVWCASVRAGVVPLFDQILAGAALGAVPVPTRAGNKPWRKLKFYNHGEGRSRG